MNRAFLLIFLLTAPGFAQSRPSTAPATSFNAPSTQAVLAGLSNDDWKVRKKSLDDLVKLGAGARGEIESMLAATNDPSVQSDLRAALRLIAENEKFGPTLFTYHAKQGKAKDAFEELGRQANCAFTPGFPNMWDSRPNVPMDFDFDEVPFWIAVRDLCQRTNLMVNPGYNQNPGLLLYPGQNNQLSGMTYSTGPFLVVAQSISRSRTINLADGANGKSSNLSMQMTIFSEPKIRVIRMTYPVLVNEAIDEKGNSLVIPRLRNGNGWSGGNRYVWNAALELKDSPEAGQMIKRLKGAANMMAIADVARLEISSTDAHEFDKIVGGVRVKVVDYGMDPGSIHFKLNCTQQGGDQQAFSMLSESVQGGQLRVVDSQGHMLQQSGLGTSGSNQGFEINGTFQNRLVNENGQGGMGAPVPPLKVQWDIPTGVKEITVPFEFRDVPLP